MGKNAGHHVSNRCMRKRIILLAMRPILQDVPSGLRLAHNGSEGEHLQRLIVSTCARSGSVAVVLPFIGLEFISSLRKPMLALKYKTLGILIDRLQPAIQTVLICNLLSTEARKCTAPEKAPV